jgi:hypothetical protein
MHKVRGAELTAHSMYNSAYIVNSVAAMTVFLVWLISHDAVIDSLAYAILAISAARAIFLLFRPAFFCLKILCFIHITSLFIYVEYELRRHDALLIVTLDTFDCDTARLGFSKTALYPWQVIDQYQVARTIPTNGWDQRVRMIIHPDKTYVAGNLAGFVPRRVGFNCVFDESSFPIGFERWGKAR